MSNNFAVHESCLGCSGGPSPGIKAYAAYAEDAWPYQTSMGIYNCRFIGGTTTYSKHACGDAYDQGIPTESNGGPIPQLGDPVVTALAANGVALGISQIIYNRKIYDRRSPNGRTYRGRHPHYNHLHISFTHGAGQNLTYAYIVLVLGDPKGEEGEMQYSKIYERWTADDILVMKAKGLWEGVNAWYIDDIGTYAHVKDWEGLVDAVLAADAALPPQQSVGGNHPDVDHDSLATKESLADHTSQQFSGPHN